jgi:lysophospholipase L1-like esterase
MSRRCLAAVLSACVQWLGPQPIASQEAGRRPPAPAETGAASGRQAPVEKIRAFLNSSRGSLEQPAELAALFERLYRLSAGLQEERVHILHFGDSHTAGDEWTARLRSLFQERFGDGGSGFSLAGHPFAGYRRLDVSGGSTGGWKAGGLQAGGGDGYFGLGGISLSSDRSGQSVYLNAACDRLEVQYLQQPNGGKLALYEDERLVSEFSTAGELKPEERVFETRPGNHRYVLKTISSGPVRLFGWVADKRTGVTYESFGLNGARASLMLHWDEQMLGHYLLGRDPALIVLAYGTNDAAEFQASIERYQEMFSNLLARLRRMSPESAILVVGPPDVSLRGHGRSHNPADVARIVVAQQNASRENGCAFWDMRQHMGGIGSMRDWAAAGLARRDYVHFSPAGYHQLAEALFADLMRYYDTYTQVRLQLLGAEFDRLQHERARTANGLPR